MSAWLRPRNFAIAGGIGAAVLLFPRTKSKAAEVSPVGNPFETQGVKNIADRYSSGGATSTHTPGVATPRGNAAAQNTPMDQKGAGTHRFNEKFADQKPEEPNAVGKAFGKAHLGSEKGK